jgi:hypothetical protein
VVEAIGIWCAMNVFEMAFVLVGLVCAFAAAVVASQYWGLWVGLVAFAVSWVVWACVLKLGDVAIDVWYKFLPVRPICRKGRCHSGDYEYLGQQDGVSVFRCRCGNEYAEMKSVFYERDAVGQLHPYMNKRWGVVWRPCQVGRRGKIEQ